MKHLHQLWALPPTNIKFVDMNQKIEGTDNNKEHLLHGGDEVSESK